MHDAAILFERQEKLSDASHKQADFLNGKGSPERPLVVVESEVVAVLENEHHPVAEVHLMGDLQTMILFHGDNISVSLEALAVDARNLVFADGLNNPSLGVAGLHEQHVSKKARMQMEELP
jgi:hypothetical protein